MGDMLDIVGDGAIGRSVYRLRDLDGPRRRVAAAFAVALSLAPLLALVRFAPGWFPAGDPALMGMRALDVGTGSTPLIGQPSLSFTYVDQDLVYHLGAVHFYLMAPFVRLLGAPVGMLTVSVLITGSCLLVSGWAIFRQLGPAAGALGAVLLGAVSFTTGASSLVNPVSSNIAGYPFLCSMVLLWCLMCGDLRLLPLATAAVSFTALQHLSVLPALAVATVAGLVGLVVALAVVRPKDERPGRREVVRWVGGSAVVGGLLWLPVGMQELFGTSPNLSALAGFTTSSERPTLGYSTAVRHMVHVLGMPPLLGRTDFFGDWLFRKPALGTWLSAGLVLALVAVAGWWWRCSHPRRCALVCMIAALVVAGLVGSASVPEGHEQGRLVFYQWIFPLAAFVALTVGLLVVDVVGHLARDRPAVRPALFGAALAAAAVPSLVNPGLDRWSNTLQAAYTPFERQVLDEFAGQVMRQRDRLDGDVLLVAREPAFRAGLDPAVTLELEQRGLTLRQPGYQGAFVADARLIDRTEVDQGLVLVLDTEYYFGRPEAPAGGDLIADVELPDGIVLGAHADHDISDPQPARLQMYLLERDELLDWVERRELDDR